MVARPATSLAKALVAGLLAAGPWTASSPAAGAQETLAGEPRAALTYLPPVREGHRPLDEMLDWSETFEPSRWSARLGAVYLQRARPRSETLLTDLGSGRSILDPSGLVFPFRAGADVGLLRRGAVADFEFRYFGVEHWRAHEGPVESTSGMQLNVPGVDPYTGPVAARLGGTSSLQSFEWNLRRGATPRWSWLVGFRYLAFRDAMRLTAGEATFTNYGTVLFGVTNNLFGAQIGGDGILWENGRWLRIKGAIKAGVYVDGARSSLTGYETTGPDRIDYRTGQDNTAFVGDMNFAGVYQLNERWALRAGYQLLWLAGVGTGSMQFHDIDLITPHFATNTSGAVFFHGALLGVERTW